MVSEPKALRLNIDFVNLPPFKLNILHVKLHLLKESLSLHVKKSVELMIK